MRATIVTVLATVLSAFTLSAGVVNAVSSESSCPHHPRSSAIADY